MNLSREYLQYCSIQTGYPMDSLEKVIRLGEVAGDITRHPFLGKVLALKGGTALNLTLKPNEEEYLAGIQRGELLPQLLFRPGSEEAKKIAEHPALLWKLANVRIHLAKQSKKKKGGVIQNDVRGGLSMALNPIVFTVEGRNKLARPG